MNAAKCMKLFLLALLFLVVVSVVLSCTNQRKVQRWNNEHPQEAAQYCADQFPAKDSISIVDSVHFDTLYVENETVLRDSFYILGDTVVKIVDKKCQPAQVITQHHTKSVYVLRVDSAAHAALRLAANKEQAARQKAEQKLMAAKDKLNWWKIACIITWSLLAVIFLGRIAFKRIR